MKTKRYVLHLDITPTEYLEQGDKVFLVTRSKDAVLVERTEPHHLMSDLDKCEMLQAFVPRQFSTCQDVDLKELQDVDTLEVSPL